MTGLARTLFAASLAGALAGSSQAAEKITYEDHVLPIFRSNCLKCHNQNEQKGGLDLSNFSGAVKGGGSGTSVSSGDADGSKLFKSITHAEEPTMPPNAKLSDKEIDVVRQWIAGGLLEGVNSKAIASNKPKVEMAVDVSSLKPKEPLPLPQDLLLQPVVRTERASVATGMAASPWSPLIALGGQRQVLLYHTETLELAGILPFPEGYPTVLRFSRNGKMLLAGGGEGARQGSAVVWEVATGERIIKVGEEFDTVLAADLSGDQKWIALGGPDRLVKIYSTEDGQLKHTIKKHTDWVTAAEFSPDGKFLATGDRNGNLHVWEAATGQELYTLKGHRNWITALSWRADSQMLVSASEDATSKLWQVKDEREARNTTAHNGGALFAHCYHDGRMVTCGRDNNITLWDANGGRTRNLAVTNDLPVRAVLTHDGNRIIGADWLGNVTVWNAADGKPLGALALNPPTLEQRLELAAAALAKWSDEAAKQTESLKAAETEAAKFAALAGDAKERYEASKLNESGGKQEQEQWKELQKQAEAADKKVAEAKAAAEQVARQFAAVEKRVVDLKAAQFNVKVHAAREQLAARETDHQKLELAARNAGSAVESAKRDLDAVRKQQAVMPDKLKGMENVIKLDRQFAKEPQDALAKAKKDLGKVESSLKRAKPDKVDAVKQQVEALQKDVAEKQAAADKAQKEIDSDIAALAKLREEEKALELKAKAAREAVRKAELELAAAKSEAEKSTRQLAADKERVDKLRAEYREMRGLPPEPVKSAAL
jgi:mono/diheme cytochrome c family protein